MLTTQDAKASCLPKGLENRLIRQLARWYDLKDHPIQKRLVTEMYRFKCVPAGRRSGKTERFKRFMAVTCWENPDGLYFIAAPTSGQVAKIYWDDMKKLSLSCLHRKPPSETHKIIYFNNGTELHLCSLDKPDRIEGKNWDGGGIDEFASTKPDAWEKISPLFDTFNPTRPDYKAWCWFLGVPDGLNHYYELCLQAETLEDWEVYTWHSADILPPDVIQAAKARMSAKQFRQEYEASFETVSGRIYEEYGKANYTDETIKDYEQLHYFCDFNYTPMSHGIAVIRDNVVFVLDEVILTSAEGHMNVTEFCDKYKNHKNRDIYLYGDASGKIGEKHSLQSEYILMEREFKKNGWNVKRKVKPANPGIKDRQNCVNALILNALNEIRLYVNPITAKWCHKGLSTVVFKEGSTFQEEQLKNKYQHITTGLGYMCDYLFPIKHVRNLKDYQLNDIYGVALHA